MCHVWKQNYNKHFIILYYLQVASSTLDASAKIYAGRVDAIHSETYKVLSGLGRGNEREKGGL